MANLEKITLLEDTSESLRFLMYALEVNYSSNLKIRGKEKNEFGINRRIDKILDAHSQG